MPMLLAPILISLACGPSPDPPATKETEILWDRWGVPHIFAASEEGAFYAFGRAQMQAHGDLIARLYGEARGRAAEYWGEEYLDSDRWVRTMGIPERAREWYRAQSEEGRLRLDAFASGMNDYARENLARIADEVEVVLPFTGEDVLAHGQRAVHFTFVASPDIVEEARGSNAWAIAPSRSESGRALLLQNPHLPWRHLFVFTEAQVAAPGTNVYGATLVGIPVLAIAFNDHLGWSHTVNTFDGADLYELALVPGGYRFDGEVRPLEEEEQRIRVRGADGALREEKLVVRRSVHGPIVSERNGRAIALRVAGLDAPGALDQWWEMGRATSLAEFESALKRLQIPMFNVLYSDGEGHILYLFGGRVPKRSTGDVDFWAGVVPGDRSETLWTEVHSYEELPRVIDPETGWLQNANDPPWTSTHPPALSPGDFPPYMSPEFLHLRAQHSARLLVEDESISFEELLRYKHSTRMLLAERVLDDLLASAREHGNEEAKRAAFILENWDFRADASSRGAVLFHFWARNWTRGGGAFPYSGDFAQSWNRSDPLATPDGLASKEKALSALESAAAEVERRYGALDVAWGDVFRIRYGGRDLPANGAPGGPEGAFRTAYFEPSEGDRFQIAGGDSYYAAIEFSSPPRARVLTAYGSATQPGSPHRGDQLELFAKQEMRPVWRNREEIEANLESRETIAVPPIASRGASEPEGRF